MDDLKLGTCGEVARVGQRADTRGLVILLSLLCVERHDRGADSTLVVGPGTITNATTNEIPHVDGGILQLHIVGQHLDLDCVGIDRVASIGSTHAYIYILGCGHVVGLVADNLLQGLCHLVGSYATLDERKLRVEGLVVADSLVGGILLASLDILRPSVGGRNLDLIASQGGEAVVGLRPAEGERLRGGQIHIGLGVGRGIEDESRRRLYRGVVVPVVVAGREECEGAEQQRG